MIVKSSNEAHIYLMVQVCVHRPLTLSFKDFVIAMSIVLGFVAAQEANYKLGFGWTNSNELSWCTRVCDSARKRKEDGRKKTQT